MAFLEKIEFEQGVIEVVIYRNSEAIAVSEMGVAKDYVADLLPKHDFLKGRKLVFILWELDGSKMADCWVFGKNESDTAGAEVAVYLFNNLESYESKVVSAADGLVVLGEEAREMINS